MDGSGHESDEEVTKKKDSGIDLGGSVPKPKAEVVNASEREAAASPPACNDSDEDGDSDYDIDEERFFGLSFDLDEDSHPITPEAEHATIRPIPGFMFPYLDAEGKTRPMTTPMAPKLERSSSIERLRKVVSQLHHDPNNVMHRAHGRGPVGMSWRDACTHEIYSAASNADGFIGRDLEHRREQVQGYLARKRAMEERQKVHPAYAEPERHYPVAEAMCGAEPFVPDFEYYDDHVYPNIGRDFAVQERVYVAARAQWERSQAVLRAAKASRHPAIQECARQEKHDKLIYDREKQLYYVTMADAMSANAAQKIPHAPSRRKQFLTRRSKALHAVCEPRLSKHTVLQEHLADVGVPGYDPKAPTDPVAGKAPRVTVDGAFYIPDIVLERLPSPDHLHLPHDWRFIEAKDAESMTKGNQASMQKSAGLIGAISSWIFQRLSGGS